MQPPRLRNNIAANYAGAGWGALMSFVFVPWTIKYLGVEAYGIIGFFASIQAVLYLLDMGLSLTFSREIASLSGKGDSGQAMRDLTRTFATVYWGIALLAGLLFVGFAPLFAHYWLKAEAISTTTITYATLIMGLSIIARWPGNIYSGGLTGLQRQVA
jgi:O-antigen/teichoic acid export membrane protein